MLLIMMMLTEKGGKIDQLDFAAKIHNWMLHGFQELGDLGMRVCWVWNGNGITPVQVVWELV